MRRQKKKKLSIITAKALLLKTLLRCIKNEALRKRVERKAAYLSLDC